MHELLRKHLQFELEESKIKVKKTTQTLQSTMDSLIMDSLSDELQVNNNVKTPKFVSSCLSLLENTSFILITNHQKRMIKDNIYYEFEIRPQSLILKVTIENYLKTYSYDVTNNVFTLNKQQTAPHNLKHFVRLINQIGTDLKKQKAVMLKQAAGDAE